MTMQLKSMAKPWPYRPDFTPTAALSVSHPTYLYQHCTWIIISIKFSTTTGRSDHIKHRLYTKKALTILEKNPIKIYESSHGKNRHPCYGVFQWNIRINSGKQRLSTISEKSKFPFPSLFWVTCSWPFPSSEYTYEWSGIQSLENWSCYNKAEGKKSKAHVSPWSDSLHDHLSIYIICIRTQLLAEQ